MRLRDELLGIVVACLESTLLFDVALMVEEEVRHEVLREVLIDAEFIHGLSNCVDTVERAVAIRVQVAELTIEQAEQVHVVLALLTRFLAFFVAAEKYEVRFECDFFIGNQLVHEFLMLLKEHVARFLSGNHPVLHGSNLTFVRLVEDD